MKYFGWILILACLNLNGQILNKRTEFTRQDSLRGSNNEFRDWWKVLHYDLEIQPDFKDKFITGINKIQFLINETNNNSIMQIDLQEPMQIDHIIIDHLELEDYRREGNVYFLNIKNYILPGKEDYEMEVHFSGHPRVAVNAPWDGGWIFARDKKSRPWMTTAVQGLGASAWYPNKDYQGEKPMKGADIKVIAPKGLVGISNGRLIDIEENEEQKIWHWSVKDPINNYNITPYIGNYVEIKDTYQGEKGELSLNYWVLDYNLEKARNQFKQAKTMLKAFEYWFGPYPFYEDGYKLVEAPHLGMEHQSAVAYGNKFENGYLGNDISGSGWGLKWDFIIVHESGHEWFGNNITAQEIADNWIHEGFTSYSEALFVETEFGKEAGSDYVIGTRRSITNEVPLIGKYGVNKEGSSDIYFKGANMIHTLRQWINDDKLFREILRGLNTEFYHQSVTTQEIENYIGQKSNLDLSAFFNQYLRTTKIPLLEYKMEGNQISYRWRNVEEGFTMPLKISNSKHWINPTSEWKAETLDDELLKNFKIDRNFYILTKEIE